MLSRTLSKTIFIRLAVSLLTVLAMLSNVTYAEDTSGRSDQGFKSVVPDLLGLTLQAASTTLPKYDLSLGAVTNEVSEATPGAIISQSEAANSEVARWAVVHVSVARTSVALTPTTDASTTETAPAPPSTPTDETTTAEATLTPALTPAPVAVITETATAIVEATAPETTSNSNRPVTTTPLELSSESVATTDSPDQEFKSLVPSLKGLTVEKATTLLPQYDLSLGAVSEEESNAVAGTIISQSEQVDKEIPRGSVINVSIAIATAQQEQEVTTTAEIIIPATSDKNSDKPKDDTTTPLMTKTPVIGTLLEKKTEIKPETSKETTDKPEEKVEVVTTSSDSLLTKKEEVDTSEEKSTITEQQVTADKPEEQNTDKNQQTEKELSTTRESATASLATGDYANHKIRINLSPEGSIQVTRDITMEMSIDPPFDDSQKLSYQFNISGKAYNSQKPIFTHVFDEEESVIVTASVRIAGKPWLHSSSKRVKVAAFKLMKIKVPNIVGLSETKAAVLLKSKGLKVGNTRDKIVKGGSGVIEQMPKAGSMRYENDNEIHYVRAIDEKFRVNVLLSRDGLETGKAVTIRASIDPKPRKKKVRFRFLVGDKAYSSPTHKWQHTFDEAGDVTVTAEAIINGAGTFASAPKTFTIAHAWVKPKAAISPFTVTVEQGEVINFESASSYDTNGVVELNWRDDEDNTNSGADFTVNTENLSEGEHWVSLRIKDEKGNIDVARAQIIVTAKVLGEKQEEKPDEAASKVADADAITQALEQAIGGSQNGTQSASETKADAPQTNENASELEENSVAEGGNVESELPKTTISSPATAIDGKAENNIEITDIDSKGFNWGILIWLILIGIVILPIFWVLRKLTAKPKPTPVSTPALIPSPQNQSINRVKKTSSRVDPDLTDFELGKAAKEKKKKEDLTNFNLDDD